MLVLRNIDHLRNVPTPALVLRPREVLNSGLMVLRVRAAAELEGLWRYYYRILSDSNSSGDGGDQQVLHSLSCRVLE